MLEILAMRMHGRPMLNAKLGNHFLLRQAT